MIKRVKAKCPNPKCKNGRVYEVIGFVPFDNPCKECGGLGYVSIEKNVPDTIIRHEHHYYKHK